MIDVWNLFIFIEFERLDGVFGWWVRKFKFKIK